MLVVTRVVVGVVVTLVVVKEVAGVLHETGINDDDETDVFGPKAVVNGYEKWIVVIKTFYYQWSKFVKLIFAKKKKGFSQQIHTK